MDLNEWVEFGDNNEYRINKLGIVQTRVRRGRSLDGSKGKRLVSEWLELKPYKGRTDKCGGYYYSINAGINGRTQSRLHALVCNIFHGPRPSAKYEIDHIDGDRSNNSAKNLRWVTHSENMRNAKERGAWKWFSENSFKFESEFEFLSVMTQINAGITNVELQRRYGKDKSSFSRLKNMQRHCGFVYRHRFLSKSVCKNDYFGGHKNFPLENYTD
jgi:hypothetical protein